MFTASRQNLRKAPSREGGGPGPNQVEVNVETGKVPSLYVLAFLIAYFVLGATLFSQWEEWSFLEGLYFSFITLTTIGKNICWFKIFWLIMFHLNDVRIRVVYSSKSSDQVQLTAMI